MAPLKDVVEALVKKEEEEEIEDSVKERKPKAVADTDTKPSPSAKPSLRSQVDAFANSTALQLLLVILLVTTSFVSAVLEIVPVRTTFVTIMILRGALTAFQSFATTLFVLEIMAQTFVRGLKFWKHPGCLVDFIVIAASVYSQSFSASRIASGHIQILTFLRYWRIVAVIIRIISNVEAAHEATISELLVCESTNKKLKAQLRLAEQWRDGDRQHRSEVEDLCVAYKNEIDMLMAALQIAARDVAKSGGAFEESEVTAGEVEGGTGAMVQTAEEVVAEESERKEAVVPTGTT